MDAVAANSDGKITHQLDSFLANRMEGILEDDSIIKSVDEEIKKITDAEKNTVSVKKNMKSSDK